MKINTLHLRIFIPITIVSFISISVFGYLILKTAELLIYRDVDEELDSKKTGVIKIIDSGENIQEEVQLVMSRNEDVVLFYRDKLILSSSDVLLKYYLHNKSQLDKLRGKKINLDFGDRILRVSVDRYKDYSIFYSRDITKRYVFIKSYDEFVLVYYILTLIFMNSLIYITISRNIKNINEISSDIEKLSYDNVYRLSPDKYSTEFRKVIKTFNRLMDRLEDSYKSQKSFVAYLSHEIKTPLSTILTNIDITLRKNRKKDEYTTTLKEIRDEILRINHIFNALSNLYKHRRVEASSIMVGEVIDNVLNILRNKIKDKNISVKVSLEENLSLNSDKTALYEVLFNIIDNGVKFNREGGEIVIDGWKEEDGVVIKVKDTGIGIRKEDLGKIFMEFYSGEDAKMLGREGFGLGLSIVKKLLELIKGDIEINSVYNVGTEITLRFKNLTP